MGVRLIVALAAGLVLGLPLAFQAQVEIPSRTKASSKAPNDIPRPDLRIDRTEVLVPVAVNDAYNRPVAGLEQENFRVFDDKIAQTITSFSMEDEPVAVALVFDTSGSMSGTERQERAAATEFFKTANPEDEFALVEFDSSPRLVVPVTPDPAKVTYQLLFTHTKGSTALLDAVFLGLHEIKKSNKKRKALVVISDGGENNSRYTPSEIKEVVRESDVLIYSIGVFADPLYTDAGGVLSSISEQTGGRMFKTQGMRLSDIAQKISIDLRNRYLVGYVPSNRERNGRYHPIEVKIVPPKGLGQVRAHWRTGYYAPTE
ncbi:MAG TPA: VWA domain-containing protein [Bryobacteraceae bacterium]|jgi:Ca-activated chloride channel family protein|nr:VWA domain-containing protein [Bryobacteraceae bacterium]